MKIALSEHTFLRWAAALTLGFALAQGALAAPPIPVPKPQPPASAAIASDPIGALMQQQGLAGSPTNLPVVIGLKLIENGNNSRFTLEFSDPVDVRMFTLAGPDRV